MIYQKMLIAHAHSAWIAALNPSQRFVYFDGFRFSRTELVRIFKTRDTIVMLPLQRVQAWFVPCGWSEDRNLTHEGVWGKCCVYERCHWLLVFGFAWIKCILLVLLNTTQHRDRASKCTPSWTVCLCVCYRWKGKPTNCEVEATSVYCSF